MTFIYDVKEDFIMLKNLLFFLTTQIVLLMPYIKLHNQGTMHNIIQTISHKLEVKTRHQHQMTKPNASMFSSAVMFATRDLKDLAFTYAS